MILFYIWSLISLPRDLDLCTLWVNKIPTIQVWYSSCPFLERSDKVTTYNMRDLYIVEFRDIKTGDIYCKEAASNIPDLVCKPDKLDNYFIVLVWHNSQSLICGIQIDHAGSPTNNEILTSCGGIIAKGYIENDYQLKYFGIYKPREDINIIIYPPDLTNSDYLNISTNKDYKILAYNLNWYGLSDPINLWQNQFDNAIIQASKNTNVPPRILKYIIGKESQFWPFWSGKNEVGLIQLTDDGADLVLSWDKGIYNIYCPQAINNYLCLYGYGYLDPDNQKKIRDIFRRSLIIYGTPGQGIDKIQTDIPIYSRILEVYYWAAAQAIYPISPSWDYAIAAYHSGLECIRSGDICQDGLGYVDDYYK
jgi:hypothetical protein